MSVITLLVLMVAGPPARSADPSPAAALTAVREDPRIGRWLNRYEYTSLAAEPGPSGAWIVTVRLADCRVGSATVTGGRITNAAGPWDWDTGDRRNWWLSFRSAVFFKHGAYVLALLGLVLVVRLGHPFAWRTADALALASFVPGSLLAGPFPLLGGLTLTAGALYLAVRQVGRAARPTEGAWPASCPAAITAGAAALALAWSVAPAGGTLALSAADVAALMAQAAVLAALVLLGCRLGASWRSAAALAASAWCLSAATGRFLSPDQAATALILFAALAWPRPIISGLCLGAACAAAWPAILLLPVWLGSFAGGSRIRFALVWAATAAALIGFPAVAGFGGWFVPTGSVGLPVPRPGAVRYGLPALHVCASVVAACLFRRPTRFGLIAVSGGLLSASALWWGAGMGGAA